MDTIGILKNIEKRLDQITTGKNAAVVDEKTALASVDKLRKNMENFLTMLSVKARFAINDLKRGNDPGDSTAKLVHMMVNVKDEDWYEHFYR